MTDSPARVEETVGERGSCLEGIAYSEGNGLDGYTKRERRTAAEAGPRTNIWDYTLWQYQPPLLHTILHHTRREADGIYISGVATTLSDTLAFEHTMRKAIKVLG
jgi:hypothetical protein